MPNLGEIFRQAENIRITTRSSYLKRSSSKTSNGQKRLSYTGPAIWNRIPELLKETKNLKTLF